MGRKTRTTYQRGFFGKIIRFLFIAFNVVMVVWIILGIANVSDMEATTELEANAQTVGGTIGVFFLIVLWALGAIILGALSYFTRGVAITEEIA